jgi:hypothetical protein
MSIEKLKKTIGKHIFSLKNIENQRKTHISIDKPKKTKGKHIFSLKNMQKPEENTQVVAPSSGLSRRTAVQASLYRCSWKNI